MLGDVKNDTHKVTHTCVFKKCVYKMPKYSLSRMENVDDSKQFFFTFVPNFLNS